MSVVFSEENYKASLQREVLPGVNRVLVMCGRGIGDTLLTLPAISCLRDTYPEAHITAIASPLSAQFLHECGYIHKIVCFDSKYSRDKVKDFLSVVFLLVSKKFDLCISFGNRFFFRLFTFMARAQYKVGRSHKKTNYLYNIMDHAVFPKNTAHEIERNVKLVSMVGNVDGFRLPFVKISEDERKWAEEFVNKLSLQPGRKLICLHIGGGSWYKLWPTDKFLAVAQKLSALPHVEVLILYGLEEEILAKKIDRRLCGGIRQYRPRNISQLKAIISQANLFICNDSGPMHIAAALNVPLVAIFGGTDVKRWEPVSPDAVIIRRNMECWPCDAYNCRRGWICIKELPVEMVWKTVKRLAVSHEGY